MGRRRSEHIGREHAGEDTEAQWVWFSWCSLCLVNHDACSILVTVVVLPPLCPNKATRTCATTSTLHLHSHVRVRTPDVATTCWDKHCLQQYPGAAETSGRAGVWKVDAFAFVNNKARHVFDWPLTLFRQEVNRRLSTTRILTRYCCESMSISTYSVRDKLHSKNMSVMNCHTTAS